MLYSCSSNKPKDEELSRKEPEQENHLVKGATNCSESKNEFHSKGVSVSFDKNICSIFEYELDSLGDTVLWFLQTVKEDSGFRPVSSLVKVYKLEEEIYSRNMSFVTWPWIEDHEKFKETTYFKIWNSNPSFMLEEPNVPKRYYSVLITIKKD